MQLLAYKAMTDEIAPPPPRIWPIFRVCFMGLVGGEILAMIVQACLASLTSFPGGLVGLSKAPEQPWWANVGGMIGIWAGLLGAVWWIHRSGTMVWLSAGGRWFRPSDTAYLAIGGAIQWLVDRAYAPLHDHNLNAPVTRLFGATHGVTFLLLALGVTVGAPIVEECFFRGTLFRGLALGLVDRWGDWGVRFAVGLSAVVFAAVHGEPLQFPGLVVVGVLTAVVFWRTQRVGPSIAMHIGFNGLAVVALMAQRWSS